MGNFRLDESLKINNKGHQVSQHVVQLKDGKPTGQPEGLEHY